MKTLENIPNKVTFKVETLVKDFSTILITYKGSDSVES